MTLSLPGILTTVPSQARHLLFSLESAKDLPAAIDRLGSLVDGEAVVIGPGESLLRAPGGVSPAWPRPCIWCRAPTPSATGKAAT